MPQGTSRKRPAPPREDAESVEHSASSFYTLLKRLVSGDEKRTAFCFTIAKGTGGASFDSIHSWFKAVPDHKKLDAGAVLRLEACDLIFIMRAATEDKTQSKRNLRISVRAWLTAMNKHGASAVCSLPTKFLEVATFPRPELPGNCLYDEAAISHIQLRAGQLANGYAVSGLEEHRFYMPPVSRLAERFADQVHRNVKESMPTDHEAASQQMRDAAHEWAAQVAAKGSSVLRLGLRSDRQAEEAMRRVAEEAALESAVGSGATEEMTSELLPEEDSARQDLLPEEDAAPQDALLRRLGLSFEGSVVNLTKKLCSQVVSATAKVIDAWHSKHFLKGAGSSSEAVKAVQEKMDDESLLVRTWAHERACHCCLALQKACAAQ